MRGGRCALRLSGVGAGAPGQEGVIRGLSFGARLRAGPDDAGRARSPRAWRNGLAWLGRGHAQRGAAGRQAVCAQEQQGQKLGRISHESALEASRPCEAASGLQESEIDSRAGARRQRDARRMAACAPGQKRASVLNAGCRGRGARRVHASAKRGRERTERKHPRPHFVRLRSARRRRVLISELNPPHRSSVGAAIAI